METDPHHELRAQIHILEKAFQQQKHQEIEWESRLKELEDKMAAMGREHRRFPDSKQSNQGDHKNPCGKDVLHLNVGGSKHIAVLRSTLTFVEGSMLATRFSGRWDDSLEKDGDGNFFIDQPPDLFIPMIEFLQCKTKETLHHLNIPFPTVGDFGGSFDRFTKFANMVEFYGMTNVVLPPTIHSFIQVPQTEFE
jgi:BTB/POZ domain